MRRNRVTSFDVAQAAGVSQSTVSRALAGSQSITDATRLRVQAAAAQLAYHPDSRAARLRSGKTGTLAIVVIGREGQDPTRVSAFHYALLGSTCAAAAERGYQSLVSFQAEPEHFSWSFVAHGQADGLIVMGTSVNHAAWEDLRAAEPKGPVVLWGAPFDDGRWVRADNVGGAQLAVERLLAAGHRRIAFLGSVNSVHPQFSERFVGYSNALAAHGLEAIAPVDVLGDDRTVGGQVATAQLLASGEPPDAIFAANDSIALGAIAALAKAGKRVPEDFGVLGFDGLSIGEHSSPPLTTIEPDFAEAGRALIARICDAGGAGVTPRVPVRLVERSSVRPPQN